MRDWQRATPLLSVFLVCLTLGFYLHRVSGRREAAEGWALSHLTEEAKDRAGELEKVLARVDRELRLLARREMDGPPRGRTGWTNDLAEHLADLGPALAGIAVLDPSGTVEWTGPGPPPELDGALNPGARLGEGGVSLRTGFTLPGGDPSVAVSLVPEGATGPEGVILMVLLALEAPPRPSLLGAYAGIEPAFTLLDEAGRILAHPFRDRIGEVLITPADSLHDPGLWGIFPQILGEKPGAWSMVSEILSPGSRVRSRVSLLAFHPVRLPEGALWHLGLSATPSGALLPGSPSLPRIAGTALLLSLLVVGIVWGLPRSLTATRELNRAAREGAWHRTLVEEGADGLAVLDREGAVVWANPALLRLTGWRKEDLEGIPFGELLYRADPTDPPGPPVTLPLGLSEVRLRGRDGQPVEVEVNAGALSTRNEGQMVALVRDMGRRRRAERETLRVGERERLLLGRELHDGLAQHLTGVAFMAKTLARGLVDRGGSGAEEAERISRLLKDAVGQIRILSKGLELSEYDGHALPEALAEMAGVVRRLMGVDLQVALELETEAGDGGLTRFQATQLYRLCHDLVSDAVRNRLARQVRIRVWRDGARVTVQVTHDGAGAREDREGEPGLPHYRLRYRARLLDAALEVRGEAGTGATTTCTFMAGAEEE